MSHTLSPCAGTGKIIEKEKPDALLPTLGGQTGLNLSLDLAKAGILEKHGVELIGAKEEAINKGEDRELFKAAMLKIGLDVARSDTVNTVEEALRTQQEIGGDFPVIIRPSFTLGGTGGGIAYNLEELEEMVAKAGPRCGKSWSKNVYWAASSRWRSCAITRISVSSFVPLKTSMLWVFILGTPHCAWDADHTRSIS